ncbi:MAG: phosphatase PAP2 family protein [Rhodospirillales bacterium]
MRPLPPLGRTGWLLVAAAAAAGAVLFAVPAIDHAAARLFYDGARFPAETDATVQAIRRAARIPGWILGAAAILSLAWRLARRRWLFGLDRKAIVYLVAVALIGPALLVNGVLKEHWGRARPYQTVDFGGDKAFTPPLIPADQCARNCSFVSGEVAYGFFFTALGFLAAAPARRRVFAAAIGFGAAIAVIRVAQGGHWLSDAYFAALFTVAIAWLLHHWIVREDAVGRLLGIARPRPAIPR